MGKRYYADMRIDVRVYFDDNGEDDLNDQAIDALKMEASIPDEKGVCEDFGITIICIEADRAD